MRAPKQFNILKHIIERYVKNDDSIIVEISHTHIHTLPYAHIDKLYNYYVQHLNFLFLFLRNITKACIKSLSSFVP